GLRGSRAIAGSSPRLCNTIGLAIILATAVPALPQTTSTTTTTTVASTTSTSTTTTTLPESVITLQELGTLQTELSLCLSFARLRERRVENLEHGCQNKAGGQCVHHVDVVRTRAEAAFQVCEAEAVERAS